MNRELIWSIQVMEDDIDFRVIYRDEKMNETVFERQHSISSIR